MADFEFGTNSDGADGEYLVYRHDDGGRAGCLRFPEGGQCAGHDTLYDLGRRSGLALADISYRMQVFSFGHGKGGDPGEEPIQGAPREDHVANCARCICRDQRLQDALGMEGTRLRKARPDIVGEALQRDRVLEIRHERCDFLGIEADLAPLLGCRISRNPAKLLQEARHLNGLPPERLTEALHAVEAPKFDLLTEDLVADIQHVVLDDMRAQEVSDGAGIAPVALAVEPVIKLAIFGRRACLRGLERGMTHG